MTMLKYARVPPDPPTPPNEIGVNKSDVDEYVNAPQLTYFGRNNRGVVKILRGVTKADVLAQLEAHDTVPVTCKENIRGMDWDRPSDILKIHTSTTEGGEPCYHFTWVQYAQRDDSKYDCCLALYGQYLAVDQVQLEKDLSENSFYYGCLWGGLGLVLGLGLGLCFGGVATGIGALAILGGVPMAFGTLASVCFGVSIGTALPLTGIVGYRRGTSHGLSITDQAYEKERGIASKDHTAGQAGLNLLQSGVIFEAGDGYRFRK